MKLSGKNGSPVWTEQFGTVHNEFAAAVSVDARDDVVVGGRTDGALSAAGNAGGLDAYVMKVSGSTGSRLWTQQYGTSSDDYVEALALDEGGNAVVVGYTSGDLGGTGNTGGIDSYVRKLASNGSTLWTRQFGTDQDEMAHAVAIDPVGTCSLSVRRSAPWGAACSVAWLAISPR